MTRSRKTVNRSASNRLSKLLETELAKHELTTEEITREARLPSKAFRSLLRDGHRPTIDRADELCRALGISMTIGVSAPSADGDPDPDDNTIQS